MLSGHHNAYLSLLISWHIGLLVISFFDKYLNDMIIINIVNVCLQIDQCSPQLSGERAPASSVSPRPSPAPDGSCAAPAH